MKSIMIAVAQVAAVSATLLLTTGGVTRADTYVGRGHAYRAYYGEQRAAVVRRAPLYNSHYDDPSADFAYAPGWNGYDSVGDYQCQQSPGSVNYTPCSNY